MRDTPGMRLRFDPLDHGDEDEFYRVREALLNEMRGWAAERLDDSDGARAAHADTFLGWKFHYADGRLDDVSRADAAEYLLEWCPRKVSAPPDTAYELVDGLAAYVEFMAATGRLVGGVDRAASVIAYLGEIADDAYAAMGDESRFGMAKSFFTAPLTATDGSALADLLSAADGLSIDELQALVDERIEAFNALPFEQRRGLTDRAFAAPASPRVELGFVHVPPANDDVEATARASRLLAMIDGLVAWLGPNGRQVTQTGAFRIADARQLVELLDTGDRLERDQLGAPRRLRSSRELTTLTLVATVAEEAEAVQLTATKMVAVPAWTELPVVERAGLMVDALVGVGILGSREYGAGIFEAIADLLDDGVPHWLVGVLPPDTERALDEVVEFAVHVCDEQFPGVRRVWGDTMWQRMIERDVHELFDGLALAALVELHDRREVTDEFGYPTRTGGMFTGTPLLRHVLPPHAHAAGYDFAEIPDLATADPVTVVMAYAAGDLDTADITRWRAAAPEPERVAALAAVAAHTAEPGARVAVFALIEDLADPAVAAPAVRQLLDSPASAHAALYLVSHGEATPAELDGFFSIGPLVDYLSLLVDEPEAMAELFAEAQDSMVDDLIEAMWRCDQTETLAVLEALGRALPDKRLAKAARKAAIKHRSWRANLAQRATE